MKLTEEQKKDVEKHFLKTPDLIVITRKVFNDEALKGSSKEGKAVRDHLIEKGLKYRTTKYDKAKPIKLSDEEKALVEEKAEEGLSSFAIAQMIFKDKVIKKLGLEQRAVMTHIKSVNPDFGAGKEGAMSTYSPPRAMARILKKINDSTGKELEEAALARHHFICATKLGINLANSRFVAIMNNYIKPEQRELFEQEFVRLTWDKPDLSADELNLYINVCKEIIHMEVITAHLCSLNERFDEVQGINDMSIRLTELIKAKSDEYHKCEGRIENLTKKLQGDRAERMKKRHENNASILSVVQLWQDEKERKNMVRMAEVQKELIKVEADRLESQDMWIARVLGVGQDDVI
jgi:hypothetical protein